MSIFNRNKWNINNIGVINMNKIKVALIFALSLFVNNLMCNDIIFLNLTGHTIQTRLIYSAGSFEPEDFRPNNFRQVAPYDTLVCRIMENDETVGNFLDVSFCNILPLGTQKLEKGYQYKFGGGIFKFIDLSKIKNKNILVVINDVPSIVGSQMIVFKDGDNQFIFSEKGTFRGLMTFYDDKGDSGKEIKNIIDIIKKIEVIKVEFKDMQLDIKNKAEKFAKILDKKYKDELAAEKAIEKELRAKEDKSWDRMTFLQKSKVVARRRLKETGKSLGFMTKFASDKLFVADDLGKFLFYVEKYGTKDKKEDLDRKILSIEKWLKLYGSNFDSLIKEFEKDILVLNGKILKKAKDKAPEYKVLFSLNLEKLRNNCYKDFFKNLKEYIYKMRQTVNNYKFEEPFINEKFEVGQDIIEKNEKLEDKSEDKKEVEPVKKAKKHEKTSVIEKEKEIFIEESKKEEIKLQEKKEIEKEKKEDTLLAPGGLEDFGKKDEKGMSKNEKTETIKEVIIEKNKEADIDRLKEFVLDFNKASVKEKFIDSILNRELIFEIDKSESVEGKDRIFKRNFDNFTKNYLKPIKIELKNKNSVFLNQDLVSIVKYIVKSNEISDKHIIKVMFEGLVDFGPVKKSKVILTVTGGQGALSMKDIQAGIEARRKRLQEGKSKLTPIADAKKTDHKKNIGDILKEEADKRRKDMEPNEDATQDEGESFMPPLEEQLKNLQDKAKLEKMKEEEERKMQEARKREKEELQKKKPAPKPPVKKIVN